MAYINRTRPSHFDAIGRAAMRGRAEKLDSQRGAFIDFMHSQRLDEAHIDRELRKFDEIVAFRREAASMDER